MLYHKTSWHVINTRLCLWELFSGFNPVFLRAALLQLSPQSVCSVLTLCSYRTFACERPSLLWYITYVSDYLYSDIQRQVKCAVLCQQFNIWCLYINFQTSSVDSVSELILLYSNVKLVKKWMIELNIKSFINDLSKHVLRRVKILCVE